MTGAPDIVVIGGGIAGISAAAELAALARVTVIEGEARLGHHSTGRSAAIFIRNYGNATLRVLNAVAEPIFLAPDGISDTPLLTPRGEMILAAEDELDAMAAYRAGASGLDDLSPDEAAALVPILRPERIAAAVIERDARDIDVDRTLQGYARLLRSRGGRIVTGDPVTALERRTGGWVVATDRERYSAGLIVNAAGAWADRVAGLAGLSALGITPMRRSAALLPAPEGVAVDRWPLFGSVTETWYAKPDAGQLMVSPADEDPVVPHDAWPDDMVLAEGLYRFEQAVTVPVTRVRHRWAGLRSFAPDRTPVVGFDDRVPDFFWLAGQGGYGVQTAPALARLCAELIAGTAGSWPADLLSALTPQRFTSADPALERKDHE